MSSPGYSTKEDVMENLLIVDVLFTSMQVAEIREIVTYGWGNFLGRSEESVPLLLKAPFHCTADRQLYHPYYK